MAANIVPTAPSDGILYASEVPLTEEEAALGDGLKTPSLIPVADGHGLVAVVKLSINGFVTGNSTFVFLQTDLGDGTWIDVAWLFWDQVQGSATFVLWGGAFAANNSFQQSRNAGSAPSPQQNGSRAVPLGGRCRITGFTRMTGGSSSAPEVSTQVKATVTYKLLHPR